jgi:hypothetical protein
MRRIGPLSAVMALGLSSAASAADALPDGIYHVEAQGAHVVRAVANGIPVALDVLAIILGARTLLAVRPASRALGPKAARRMASAFRARMEAG